MDREELRVHEGGRGEEVSDERAGGRARPVGPDRAGCAAGCDSVALELIERAPRPDEQAEAAGAGDRGGWALTLVAPNSTSAAISRAPKRRSCVRRVMLDRRENAGATLPTVADLESD
ncbi:MAG: hypothetical protein DWG75_02530 [Chloroflexi bacterium]|nr:hypothetical protein [Chloroflexota bacterium]